MHGPSFVHPSGANLIGQHRKIAARALLSLISLSLLVEFLALFPSKRASEKRQFSQLAFLSRWTAHNTFLRT